MTRTVLDTLVRRCDLTRAQAGALMHAIMSGELSDAQVAGVLVGLRAKGETVEEIAGFADAMRERLVPVALGSNGALDTCGTGGDGAGTFNVSTATAIVAAGMGITVAKHGNRAVSSRCGSADVLEALGVRLSLRPRDVARLIERAGIGFLFAPTHHPAMKYAAVARRELGLRTVFNLLGPLTNPAGVRRQLVGVYDAALTETVARVLQALGSECVYAVHGMDGTDEVSVSAPTRVSALRDGTVRTYRFDPASLGLRPCAREAIAGGSAADNADTIEEILGGGRGPRRDAVVVNAAFAAMAAGRAETPQEGAALAAEAIDSGRARDKLETLRRVSQELSAL
jgi:anthranilate phosphoribosyltransferase